MKVSRKIHCESVQPSVVRLKQNPGQAAKMKAFNPPRISAASYNPRVQGRRLVSLQVEAATLSPPKRRESCLEKQLLWNLTRVRMCLGAAAAAAELLSRA